jgi:hypothetical protein
MRKICIPFVSYYKKKKKFRTFFFNRKNILKLPPLQEEKGSKREQYTREVWETPRAKIRPTLHKNQAKTTQKQLQQYT